MSPKEPPADVRTAALSAFQVRHRQEHVIDLTSDERRSLGAAAGLTWSFAGAGCHVTLQLRPAAAGWTATASVGDEPAFDVTVFRSEGAMASRVAVAGLAELGLITPGPFSMTCRLPDGRALQTSWVSMPRPPRPAV